MQAGPASGQHLSRSSQVPGLLSFLYRTGETYTYPIYLLKLLNFIGTLALRDGHDDSILLDTLR